MHPIIKTTFCAFVAAGVADPAVAATNYYLKLDDVKGESAARASDGKQLEIESWSWGATNAGAKGGNVEFEWKVEEGESVVSPRDVASGMPTGKRQHGWNTNSKPLERGSVRVKVKFPWLDCRVGAAFPDAVLQNDAGRYELKEVLISGCAPNGVALNYARYRESPTRASQK